MTPSAPTSTNASTCRHHQQGSSPTRCAAPPPVQPAPTTTRGGEGPAPSRHLRQELHRCRSDGEGTRSADINPTTPPFPSAHPLPSIHPSLTPAWNPWICEAATRSKACRYCTKRGRFSLRTSIQFFYTKDCFDGRRGGNFFTYHGLRTITSSSHIISRLVECPCAATGLLHILLK
jgi:hypothetical protein